MRIDIIAAFWATLRAPLRTAHCGFPTNFCTNEADTQRPQASPAHGTSPPPAARGRHIAAEGKGERCGAGGWSRCSTARTTRTAPSTRPFFCSVKLNSIRLEGIGTVGGPCGTCRVLVGLWSTSRRGIFSMRAVEASKDLKKVTCQNEGPRNKIEKCFLQVFF